MARTASRCSSVQVPGGKGIACAALLLAGCGGGSKQENLPPALLSTAYEMDADRVLEVQLTASDPEAQTITYAVASNPIHGDATLTETGTLTFKPAKDFSGKDSIGIRLVDSEGAVASRVVTITVRPVYEPPAQLVPDGFVGHWASSAEECQEQSSGGNLLVRKDTFQFGQNYGRVLAVRQIGPQDMEFDMALSGEARGSVRSYRFQLSEDLLTLSDLTESSPASIPVRTRCAGVPLLPVDEASADEGFDAFRTQLLSAIDRRDKSFILSIVDPHILNSFGGDGGIEEFEKDSRLDDADSWFWKEFGTVMRMGGGFSGPDSFRAPYTDTHWPNGLDAWWHVAVIARDAEVRSAPSMDSEVVATVSYTTLPVAGNAQYDKEWRFVSLADGRLGYMQKDLARSPLEHRALFARRDGRWWLVAFVSGD